VEKFGLNNWVDIAKSMNGRIGKQCRERWYNHLQPDIKVSFLKIKKNPFYLLFLTLTLIMLLSPFFFWLSSLTAREIHLKGE